MLQVYEYKGHTITAWTQTSDGETRGVATITYRDSRGVLSAKTYACPLLCGAAGKCLAQIRRDLTTSIDRQVYGPGETA